MSNGEKKPFKRAVKKVVKRVVKKVVKKVAKRAVKRENDRWFCVCFPAELGICLLMLYPGLKLYLCLN
jgi:hypothetical protein